MQQVRLDRDIGAGCVHSRPPPDVDGRLVRRGVRRWRAGRRIQPRPSDMYG